MTNPVNEVSERNASELGLLVGVSDPENYLEKIGPILNGLELIGNKAAVASLMSQYDEDVPLMAETVKEIAESIWDFTDPDMVKIYKISSEYNRRFQNIL